MHVRTLPGPRVLNWASRPFSELKIPLGVPKKQYKWSRMVKNRRIVSCMGLCEALWCDLYVFYTPIEELARFQASIWTEMSKSCLLAEAHWFLKAMCSDRHVFQRTRYLCVCVCDFNVSRYASIYDEDRLRQANPTRSTLWERSADSLTFFEK